MKRIEWRKFRDAFHYHFYRHFYAPRRCHCSVCFGFWLAKWEGEYMQHNNTKEVVMTDFPPGRELDALVAEKVMGIRVIDKEGKLASGEVTLTYPAYSTHIAAAWEVVERVWADNNNAAFTLARTVGGGYNCRFWIDGQPEYAVTAPHAICLAALGALGGQNR